MKVENNAFWYAWIPTSNLTFGTSSHWQSVQCCCSVVEQEVRDMHFSLDSHPRSPAAYPHLRSLVVDVYDSTFRHRLDMPTDLPWLFLPAPHRSRESIVVGSLHSDMETSILTSKYEHTYSWTEAKFASLNSCHKAVATQSTAQPMTPASVIQYASKTHCRTNRMAR